MNSITLPQEKIKLKRFRKIKKPLIKIPKIKNPFTNTITSKNSKEISLENRFFFNITQKYQTNNTSRGKYKKISIKKPHSNSDRKIDSYFKQNITRNSVFNKTNQNFLNNQFYPKTRLSSYRIKMLYSAKNNIINMTHKNTFSPILKNGFKYNYVDINSTNLVNLEKIWDDFGINNQYRNFFKYIYKELEPSYKQELYLKEIEETKSVENCVKDFKYFINQRKEVLSEIKILNNNLEQELLSKNQNGKEVILNQISDKIISLREHTVNICKSMRKLKYYIFSINNLDKYNFDFISKKFDFDKNYLIKMKSELKFLREGFAKYYFNIENDQTPFLLKASDKTKINEGDYFIRIIPLKDELRKEILDCDFYIHQELIAYQNANFENKNFRCISPIKREDLFIEKTEINKKFEIEKTKGSVTERKKDENINGSGDKDIRGSLGLWPELKKYKDIDGYLEINKKKTKRTIDSNKNLSANNIGNMNILNNLLKKNNSAKVKVKEKINYLIKTEINKTESKAKDNRIEKNSINEKND